MRDQVDAVWRLTRFREYAAFVVVTTLLGAAAGHGSLGLPLVVVLLANWLSVGFAFMINDVEDAPDDALSHEKALRNPVASGHLSARVARLLCLAVALIAVILYATLGRGPLLAGTACLILAFFYSSRSIRLKATPIADLACHALILAGLQFITAYLTFDGGATPRWASPLALVLAISVYGQLFNELRDFDVDVQAGVTHTAAFLGRRRAHSLMMVWLLLGLVSGAVSIFVVQLVPFWVIPVIIALTLLFSWRRLPEVRLARSSIARHRPLQKPLEIATAIALLAWFVGPLTPALASRLLAASPW